MPCIQEGIKDNQLMDSHKNHKAFVQVAEQFDRTSATISALMCLVHVWFPLETYV